MDNTLEFYRNKIDDIDKAIVTLLNYRMDMCDRIGLYKARNNFSIENKTRETEVIESLKEKTPYKHLIETVWQDIFNFSKQLQEEKKFG